jgi:hypothetical protein
MGLEALEYRLENRSLNLLVLLNHRHSLRAHAYIATTILAQEIT